MNEYLSICLAKIVEILDFLVAFVVAYFSIAGGIFISIIPLPHRLSASLFFGLNFLIFLWIFSFILGRKTTLKNPFLWLCSICFSIAGFLISDKILLFSIFLFIIGAYFYISRDNLASIKLFERLRIKFNQQRNKL